MEKGGLVTEINVLFVCIEDDLSVHAQNMMWIKVFQSIQLDCMPPWTLAEETTGIYQV